VNLEKMPATILTRGRSGSEGSIKADDIRLREFLFNEGIEVPFGVTNGCDVTAFFVFAIIEVDMFERRSLIAMLERSD
jgi:hypothetical protein